MKVVSFTRAPWLIDARGITRADWHAIGITHEDIWFNRANAYRVDASDFPTAVMEYFESDPDFTIETKKDLAAGLLIPDYVDRGPSGTDLRRQGFMDPDATDAEEAVERQARSGKAPRRKVDGT